MVAVNFVGVYLSDDNFMDNKEKVKEVTAAFKKNNLPITWDTRGRIDDLEQEILEDMKASGCTEILLDLESSDTKTDINYLRNEIQHNNHIKTQNRQCKYMIKREENKIKVFLLE